MGLLFLVVHSLPAAGVRLQIALPSGAEHKNEQKNKKCSLVETDSYHIIDVKDDRFIGHGLNLSWKGKRPHPPRFMVVRTSTPL